MDESRRCTAKSKQSGERCKRAAIPGGKVCSIHGGKIPRVQAAAQRRLDLAKAETAVKVYGIPVEVDPHEALLQELHRTAGHVSWLGLLIGDLDDEKQLSQYTEAGRRPSVWVELYQHERKHLTDVAKTCIAAGIAERQVQLAESQGKLLAEVVRQIVTGLGHDLQDERVREVVVPALQLVRAA
jgi:hypothetical protein